jgi:DNA processing protein
MDEQTAQLLLLSAPDLSSATYLALLDELESPIRILNAGQATWRAAGLSARCCDYLNSPDSRRIEYSRRWLDSPNHHLLMLQDERYPQLLRETVGAPLGLFISGNPDSLNTPQLAMVGSRNPTPYGRQIAESFAKHLSQCGLNITSGLATGIDAASHRGALAGGGLTLAVCGTGLDIIYPPSSEALGREIENQGALVSEFLPGTPPRKHHFPQRNRLISGLSLGTLVVEAAPESGSLITARLAAEQGREVFAIPGSIHSPMSKGCHELIRQGAKLVDSVQDILSELGSIAATLIPSVTNYLSNVIDSKSNSQVVLDKDYKILLDALAFEPLAVDQLVYRTGFSADAITSMLLMLELENRIESYPGGLYLRAH